MKRNLVLFALMVLIPLLAKSQTEDSLKNKKMSYDDPIFGSIRYDASLIHRFDPTSRKIVFRNKLDASFNLKNHQFQTGAKILYSFRQFRNYEEERLNNSLFVGFGTFSYSPFLKQKLRLTVGYGFTTREKVAQCYSVEYTNNSLFPKSVFIVEGNMFVIGDFKYDLSVFVLREGGLVYGGYIDNDILGACLGFYSKNSVTKTLISREKIGEVYYWPIGIQTTIVFLFERNKPKPIYR